MDSEGPDGPTLNEILSHRDLNKEHLQRECLKNVRLDIANELKDWKMVGCYLNLSEQDLIAVHHENHTEAQRRVAMLETWHEKERSKATYLRLADALHRHGRNDLVEMLCQIVKKTNMEETDKNQVQIRTFSSTEAVTERIATLENQFSDLHRRLQLELTEGDGVLVDDFFQALRMLPIAFQREYQGKIRAMSLTAKLHGTMRVTADIFLHYSPRFTFIDYALLKHLISKFGGDTLKEKMATYTAEVELFKKETTVAEVMDIWPGNQTEIHFNYTKLRVKFEGDPRTYTLEKLDRFRRRFCSQLQLPEFIFWLISMEPAVALSFFVMWCIPTVVVQKLIKDDVMNRIQQTFFLEEKILSLSLIDYQKGPFQAASCMKNFKYQLEEGIKKYCRNLESTSISDDCLMNAIDENVTFIHTEQDLITKSISYTVSVKSNATFHLTTNNLATCSSMYADINIESRASDAASEARRNVVISNSYHIGYFAGFLAGLIAILVIAGNEHDVIDRMVVGVLAGIAAGAIVVAGIDTGLLLSTSNIRTLSHYTGEFFNAFTSMAFFAILDSALQMYTNMVTVAGDYGRDIFVGAALAGFVTAKVDTSRVARALLRLAKDYTNYFVFISSCVLFGVTIFAIAVVIQAYYDFVAAFTTVVIQVFNIGGFVGGLLAGLIMGYVRTHTIGTLSLSSTTVNKLEAVALGVIGGVAGCITAAVFKVTIGNAFPLTAITGAGLGGFAGLVSGVLVVFTRIILTMSIANTTVANYATTVAVAGGLTGVAIGAYFTASVILEGLIGIAFTITSVAILTAIVYMAKIFRSKRQIQISIPLSNVIENFGEVTKPSVDQDGVSDACTQYKITLL